MKKSCLNSDRIFFKICLRNLILKLRIRVHIHIRQEPPNFFLKICKDFAGLQKWLPVYRYHSDLLKNRPVLISGILFQPVS